MIAPALAKSKSGVFWASMDALVITGRGTVGLKTVDAPARNGECLIRVRMAGICGTDLQLLEGYADFHGIPGHEFVGVVEEAPSADAQWVGRRVVGEINVGCRRCSWCASGIKEHCVNRSVVGIRGRDGAFAEMLTLPATNLHHVPDSISDEMAVFTEPTAAACRILEQIDIPADARVAVVGDGRMGLLIGQVLSTAAEQVTIFGRHEPKLAIARAFGITALPAETPIEDAGRFDVVVDASGRPEGMRRALAIVRPRGTVVMKSTFHGEAALATWPIVVDEIVLVGSRCGPFRRALELLESAAVNVNPLISRIASLQEYESAFADARRAIKVLFRMS